MPKRAPTRRSIKNIHHSPPIPAIYKYPIEIFDEIFSMACTDGGATGRSLSTVSKRIREVSKVFKYQTLLVTQNQLRPLACVLHSLPLDSRRVVHLSILSSFFYHYDRFLDIDKNRVLALVAHSIRILEFTGNYAQLLPPITLPFLQNLNLYGGFKVVKKCPKKACYPALKRFYLNYPSYRVPDGHNLFSPIMRNAPTLKIFKLLCHTFGQYAIEDFLEKPTSLKILLCPCYGSHTGRLKSEIETFTKSYEVITIEE